MVPGTPTERPPTTASMNGIGLPSRPMNRSGFAVAGAVSRPSSVESEPRPASLQCTRKAPPPMPELCGSTRLSTSCTAIAASTALPPARSISRPASAASGFAAATMYFWAVPRLFAVRPVGASGAGASCCAKASVPAAASPTAQTTRKVRSRIMSCSVPE